MGLGQGMPHARRTGLLMITRRHPVAAQFHGPRSGEPVTMAAEASRCTLSEGLFRCGLACLIGSATRARHLAMREGPGQAQRTASRRNLHLPCRPPAYALVSVARKLYGAAAVPSTPS